MTTTKHKNNKGLISHEITLNRLSWKEQHLILDALMTERRILAKDHSEIGEARWEQLSDLITKMIDAL
jgi:hypothetical protein